MDDLRHAVQRVRALDGWVVLPEHMHAVWTLPEGDDDFPRRWRAIKDLFSCRLDPLESLSGSRSSQGGGGYGSAAIGSTPSAMTGISTGISSIFISIPSSMDT